MVRRIVRKGSNEVAAGKTHRINCATTPADDENDAEDDSSCDMSRTPQDVVIRKDSVSVVSGISNPEFMDDDDGPPIDIPEAIHEAGEQDGASSGGDEKAEAIEVKDSVSTRNGKPSAVVTATDPDGSTEGSGFMSPGKPKKKVKKKKPAAVVVEDGGAATAISSGTVAKKVTKKFAPPSLPEDVDVEARSTRGSKIRVIKKIKIPEVAKTVSSRTSDASNTFTPSSSGMEGDGDDPDEKSTKSGTKAKNVAATVSTGSIDGDVIEEKPVKAGPIRRVLNRINSLSSSSHKTGPSSADGSEATEEHRSIRTGGKKPMKNKSFTQTTNSSSHGDGDDKKVDATTVKRGTRERARSKDPTSRARSRDPTSRARSKDPTSRAKSVDPTTRASSKERAASARDTEPASRSRSKEPASRSRSKEPTSRARSREPKPRDEGTNGCDGSTKPRSTTSFTPASYRDPEKLRVENEVLLEETAVLRRQLNEANAALDKVKATPAELAKLHVEMDRLKNESQELRHDIEEYEGAMAEKDSLIKKLTEAVDAQLDKVEYLELKLQRAEEEFCKMEDEMKDMEEEIELGRRHNEGSGDEKSTSYDCSSGDASEHRPISEEKEELDRGEMNIEDGERELEERERVLLEKEEDLKERERLLNEETKSLKLSLSGGGGEGEGNHEVSNYKQAFHAKSDELIILKRTISRLTAEISELEIRLTANNKSDDNCQENIDDLRARLVEVEAENAQLVEDNEHLLELDANRTAKEREAQNQRDDETMSIQLGINKQLEEFYTENRELRQTVEGLKFQNEDLKDQQNRLAQRVERKESGETNDDHYTYELEVEIADLREKIVEQEEHSRRQKEEIARVFVENEEVKQELQEREIELRDLESQLSESKETSVKKLSKKDDTIAFMQTEIMRIMQEKQQVDKRLREKKVDETESKRMIAPHQNGVDEEAEIARLQTINDQLRLLDDENQRLVEELKETQFKNQLRQKEHQSIVLELQEELSDAKWELGARKEGADYITLLKDRKDRKRELDKARKAAKQAEERLSDLERENAAYELNKQELEREIEQLNKNAVSIDSGEYVSGLKRQIKSLKQHNMALDRKIEVDARTAEDKVRLREAKVKILEHELAKLKNPTQAAVRSIFSGFGRRNVEDEKVPPGKQSKLGEQEQGDEGADRRMNEDGEEATEVEVDISSRDGREGTGDNKEISEIDAQSSVGPKEMGGVFEQPKKLSGGSIWNIFSPRRTSKKIDKSSEADGMSSTSHSSEIGTGLKVDDSYIDCKEAPTQNGGNREDRQASIEGDLQSVAQIEGSKTNGKESLRCGDISADVQNSGQAADKADDTHATVECSVEGPQANDEQIYDSFQEAEYIDGECSDTNDTTTEGQIAGSDRVFRV